MEDGRLKINGEHSLDPNDEDSIAHAIGEMPETCALDVADTGEHTQDGIADLLGMSHQRVEQIESRALERARRAGHDYEDAREHPEDSYLKYFDMGYAELAELTAILKARGKVK
jgi:hypothetical protein